MQSDLDKLRYELNNKSGIYIGCLLNPEVVKLSQQLDNEIIESQRSVNRMVGTSMGYGRGLK